MKLPQEGPTSGADISHYGRQRVGAPARDVSWHPRFPVLASTSFDRTVKVWTVQGEVIRPRP